MVEGVSSIKIRVFNVMIRYEYICELYSSPKALLYFWIYTLIIPISPENTGEKINYTVHNHTSALRANK